MKAVLKILTALAAVIGAAYVIATYGDKIVAWAKELMAKLPCNCKVELEDDFVAESAPADEPVVEEVPVEDEAVEEVVIEAHEPVADEADFA